jgi:hypothetical protein
MASELSALQQAAAAAGELQYSPCGTCSPANKMQRAARSVALCDGCATLCVALALLLAAAAQRAEIAQHEAALRATLVSSA